MDREGRRQALPRAAGGAGGSGATGDGAGGSGSRDGGMWLSLSQVQEWVLEFSCDQLFISIRTDVAWYRLSQCAPCHGRLRSVPKSVAAARPGCTPARQLPHSAACALLRGDAVVAAPHPACLAVLVTACSTCRRPCLRRRQAAGQVCAVVWHGAQVRAPGRQRAQHALRGGARARRGAWPSFGFGFSVCTDRPAAVGECL